MAVPRFLCEFGSFKLIGALGAAKRVSFHNEPEQFDSKRLFCSVSVSTSPKDTAVVVHARNNEGVLPSTEVTLGPFNRCAENIAYVELRVTGNGWGWTDVEYLNPCSQPL
jgi:hypothetical protein